jgi:hypothetical protein
LTIKEAPAISATLRKRINNRAAYRMVAKGFPDADGYQRFSYPDPQNDLTQESPATDRRTITIPLLIPEERTKRGTRHKAQPIKFLQKFPYLTEQWARHMGMRSLVEGSNSLLKLGSAEDMGVPAKRSGRGYAFQYLAMALASASSNVRRIVTFFEEEAKRTAVEVQHRARYRKDHYGAPLARQGEISTLSPPG